MKKIMLIFGTRPEAIKMCPLALELNRRKGIETVVCVTGQHKEMLRDVPDIFDISPNYDLVIMKEGQDLFDIAIHILEGILEVLQKEKPDCGHTIFMLPIRRSLTDRPWAFWHNIILHQQRRQQRIC